MTLDELLEAKEDHKPVQKTKGYKWPGIIVAIFANLKGELRVVVECTVPEVAGALHIYSPEQLSLLGAANST